MKIIFKTYKDMVLNFTKQNGSWVAEFNATADFSLHIEGVKEGQVRVYQSSCEGGKYALVRDAAPSQSYGTVYDYDFTSLVYPKFIKVVCPSEPTYAEIVTTGEVTELKHQSKAVEITANGTTSITPDAGFAALNAVEVKVNVPQGGGSASSVEYLDMSNDNMYGVDVLAIAILECKGVSDAISMVAPAINIQPLAEAMGLTITQVKVDFNTPIVMNQNGSIVKQTALEMLLSRGVTQDMLDAIPRLTKEEFYTL